MPRSPRCSQLLQTLFDSSLATHELSSSSTYRSKLGKSNPPKALRHVERNRSSEMRAPERSATRSPDPQGHQLRRDPRTERQRAVHGHVLRPQPGQSRRRLLSASCSRRTSAEASPGASMLHCSGVANNRGSHGSALDRRSVLDRGGHGSVLNRGIHRSSA